MRPALPVHRRPVPAAGRTARTAGGLLLAGAALAAVLTGCSTEDAICGGGEYPAMTVGGTGSMCVRDGEEPPAGYTRYPEGKVPRHVGDRWDVYWDTHTVDEHGRTVEVHENE